MPLTASQLRADVYNLLDHVIETGEPLEILRHGVKVRLTAERSTHWLDNLVDRRHLYPVDVSDLPAFTTPYDWSPDMPDAVPVASDAHAPRAGTSARPSAS